MHRLVAVFAICAVMLVGCKQKDQPAESATGGNATDRSADGASGTGEPRSVAADSAGSATTTGTGPLTITGTEDVHSGAVTATTATIATPTTTTMSVATPTDTSATTMSSGATSTISKTPPKKQ